MAARKSQTSEEQPLNSDVGDQHIKTSADEKDFGDALSPMYKIDGADDDDKVPRPSVSKPQFLKVDPDEIDKRSAGFIKMKHMYDNSKGKCWCKEDYTPCNWCKNKTRYEQIVSRKPKIPIKRKYKTETVKNLIERDNKKQRLGIYELKPRAMDRAIKSVLEGGQSILIDQEDVDDIKTKYAHNKEYDNNYGKEAQKQWMIQRQFQKELHIWVSHNVSRLKITPEKKEWFLGFMLTDVLRSLSDNDRPINMDRFCVGELDAFYERSMKIQT